MQMYVPNDGLTWLEDFDYVVIQPVTGEAIVT
jgi:hypothetical protein